MCGYVYIKFLEQLNLERERGVSGCQGLGVEAEMKSSCLILGYRLPFGDDKNILELNGSGGCVTL